VSCLLQLLAKGLDANVGEMLEGLYSDAAGPPLAELEAACRAHPQRADLRYQLGLAHLEAMRFDQAARELSDACRLNPDHLRARLALAGACDELGETSKALEQLRTANQTHPGEPAVLLAIGYCLEKLSRSGEAAEYYRDVIRSHSDCVPARQRLAAIAVLADDLPEAIDQYEHLRRLAPNDTFNLTTLAHLYHRAGRHEQAIAAFEKVIALEPDNWALMDDEVELLVEADRLPDAVDRLCELLEAQGPFADLHLRLAELLSKMGQDEPATRHFLAALEADRNYLEAWIGLGTHHIENGRWDEGAESFLRAAEINDRLLSCYVGLGVAHAAAGRRADAINSFQLAGAVEPNSSLLLKEMARLQLKAAVAEGFDQCFAHQTGVPVAEAELDRDDLLQLQLDRHAEQVRRHPEYADVRYRYGVLLRAEGRLGEAAEQFAEAVGINPAYVDAVIRLGVTQQELGRIDQAIETFRKALELKSEYVDVHYRLALLHTDRRHFAEAVEHMEKAAGLAPGNERIRASLALSLQNMGLMDRVAATWRSLCRMHREAGQTPPRTS